MVKEIDDPLALPSSSYCRTCKKLRKKHSIFLQQAITETTNDTKSYAELLNDLLKNQPAADMDSALPQYICRKCGTLLKRIYLFILQAENCYKDYLQKINVKSEECISVIRNPLELTEPQIKTETELDVIHCSNLKATKIIPAVKEEPNDNCDPNTVRITGDLRSNNNTDDISELNSANSQNSERNSSRIENTANITEQLNLIDEENESDSEESDFSNTSEGREKDYFHLPRNSWARRCELCNKVYKNAAALYIHKKYTHMPDDQKTLCKLCSYKTSRLSNLKAHLKAVHGQESMNNFINSIPNHESKRTFSCNVCNRKYTRKYDLQRHFKRKHTNTNSGQRLTSNQRPTKPQQPKPADSFLCTFCGQAYKTKSGLCMHIRRHTGERPYKCELCEKRFARREELRLHRVIHYDDKPYNCTECNKSFKRTDKLKIHMRVHSELRPYKCTECDKSFKYANVLRTHMHIHTGEKPFSCSTCGENFSLRSSLKMHCIKHNHE